MPNNDQDTVDVEFLGQITDTINQLSQNTPFAQTDADLENYFGLSAYLTPTEIVDNTNMNDAINSWNQTKVRANDYDCGVFIPNIEHLERYLLKPIYPAGLGAFNNYSTESSLRIISGKLFKDHGIVNVSISDQGENTYTFSLKDLDQFLPPVSVVYRTLLLSSINTGYNAISGLYTREELNNERTVLCHRGITCHDPACVFKRYLGGAEYHAANPIEVLAILVTGEDVLLWVKTLSFSERLLFTSSPPAEYAEPHNHEPDDVLSQCSACGVLIGPYRRRYSSICRKHSVGIHRYGSCDITMNTGMLKGNFEHPKNFSNWCIYCVLAKQVFRHNNCGRYYGINAYELLGRTIDFYDQRCIRCTTSLSSLVADMFGNPGNNPHMQSVMDPHSAIQAWNFKPDPVWLHRETEEIDLQKTSFAGIEIEVELRPSFVPLRDSVAKLLTKRLKNIAYCKFDSSVPNGFEVVSHPGTLDWWQDPDNAIFKELRQLSKVADSFWSENCGTHVHFSKAPFSKIVMAKYLSFIYQNKDFMIFLSERYAGGHAPFSEQIESNIFYYANNMSMDLDKHTFINLVPPHTIELRSFKGNLKRIRVLKNIEFCYALFEYCNDVEATGKISFPRYSNGENAAKARGALYSMTAQSFIKWVGRNKETYPHLYSFIKNYKKES